MTGESGSGEREGRRGSDSLDTRLEKSLGHFKHLQYLRDPKLCEVLNRHFTYLVGSRKIRSKLP